MRRYGIWRAVYVVEGVPSESEGRTGLLQEGGFFSAAGAAEDGIAVRVAAEAVDDGLVFAFEFGDVRRSVAGEDVHGGGVDGGAFAVHQRQQGELAFGRAEGGEVVLPLDFLREDERHAVLREGERAVPMQVARELVEDDDFSEATARGFAPVAEFACRRLLPDAGKAGADVGVESVAFREPPRLGFRAEPVVKDGLWGQGYFLFLEIDKFASCSFYLFVSSIEITNEPIACFPDIFFLFLKGFPSSNYLLISSFLLSSA